MNTPIYRAWCEKDSEYAVGFFISDDKENEILTRLDSGEMYARGIDITTLAIHFPDMLDSGGNKIFASLNTNGKGGDIVENYCFSNDYKEQIAIYDNYMFCLVDKDRDIYCLSDIENDGLKIIGVQK